jgi:hypothetical protein
MGNPGHRSRIQQSPGADDSLGGADDLAAPASDVRQLLPPSSIPELATTREGLRLLALDAEAAYLLSLVDGTYTLETILDVCEMDRDEALGILARLIRLGAVKLRDPQP